MRSLQQAAGSAVLWPPPPSPLPSPPLPSPPPPPYPPNLLYRVGTAALDNPEPAPDAAAYADGESLAARMSSRRIERASARAEQRSQRSPKDSSADKAEDSHLEVLVEEEPAPA